MASFSKTFDFNLRRDHQKNFLWASRLGVGRRKEPILGYVPKNDEKKNSGGKGLIKLNHFKFPSFPNTSMASLYFPSREISHMAPSKPGQMGQHFPETSLVRRRKQNAEASTIRHLSHRENIYRKLNRCRNLVASFSTKRHSSQNLSWKM